MSTPAIEILSLTYRYGERTAVRDLSLSVEEGIIFGLLGPNGGGKTTTFNVLATRYRVAPGVARIAGYDVATAADEVRRHIGVVFQSPALDGKLTVAENLTHHGHLYGLRGRELAFRIENALRVVGMADRAGDRVEHLSGGMRRRVEIAKVLVHAPRVLLMDEPTTGLDPTARATLWQHLRQLRARDGVTILITTHLFEDAENCDRIGILDRGTLVAVGTPDELKAAVGGETLIIFTDQPDDLLERLKVDFPDLEASIVRDHVRAEHPEAHALIPRLVELYGPSIRAITFGRPGLADAFFKFTGHEFEDEEESAPGV